MMTWGEGSQRHLGACRGSGKISGVRVRENLRIWVRQSMRGKSMRVRENCVDKCNEKRRCLSCCLVTLFHAVFTHARFVFHGVFHGGFRAGVHGRVRGGVHRGVHGRVCLAGRARQVDGYRAAHGACARTMKYKKCARAPTFPLKCWLSSPFASLHASLCDPHQLSRQFLRQPTRQHLLQRSQALSHPFVCQSMRQPLRQPSCCYSICPSPCAIPCASPCTRFCTRPLAVFLRQFLRKSLCQT